MMAACISLSSFSALDTDHFSIDLFHSHICTICHGSSFIKAKEGKVILNDDKQ